jgi:aspartate kinase
VVKREHDVAAHAQPPLDAAGHPLAIIDARVHRATPTSTVVMKFGGTSVADATCMKRVAKRIVDTRKEGYPVVAVVSARGDTTDDLLQLAREITSDPPERELDMLLSAGERISAALMVMAIHELGYEAISLSGPQAGIVTDSAHTKAKIVDIRPHRVQHALDDGKIVLVAGFQGLSPTTDDVTTLGRGGSDTTAVALAAALGARVCEIYTDVDGVYTADPRIVPEARKLNTVSYEEMLELAASGAKVLMLRCVEFGRRYGVPIHVRSSFTDVPGTWIQEEQDPMEQAIISGVTYALEDAKVSVHGLPDRPGVAARVFTLLAAAHINVDMIIQNSSEDGITDISFTAGEDDLAKAESVLSAEQESLGFESIETDASMAKVSLVGAGMKTHPGVAAKMFEVLAENGINIEMISTSSIKISCVIRKEHVERAVRALHETFKLDKNSVTRDEIFS